MSFLDAGKVADAQITFQTRFNEFFARMGSPEAFWNLLATVTPTNTAVMKQKWFGNVPGLKKWVGERSIGKVQAFSKTVTVAKWASGLEVDQDDLDDDTLGIYLPKIQQLAQKAAIHRLNRLVDCLLAGFGSTSEFGAAYDGEDFFSSSHAWGDNTGTASIDDTNALNNAIAAMLAFTDEDGEPLGIEPTHLIHGPSLRAEVREQLIADRNSNGASNTNFQVLQPFMSGKLVGDFANYWFVVSLNQPMKPLELVMRQEVTFDSVTAGDQKFLTDKLYFGCHARYEAAFGLPQLAWGSTGSA